MPIQQQSLLPKLAGSMTLEDIDTLFQYTVIKYLNTDTNIIQLNFSTTTLTPSSSLSTMQIVPGENSLFETFSSNIFSFLLNTPVVNPLVNTLLW